MIDQKGLIWERGLWSSTPKWAFEPFLEAVAETVHQHLQLSTAEVADASIEFLNQGAFNKLYTITCSRGIYVMRVTLPVDPVFKTASEVATLEMVSSSTRIPVPAVLGFDTSRANPIGFEWMLLDRVPGLTLEKAWPQLSWSAKTLLVKSMADVVSQMFQMGSNKIGNVYHGPNSGLPGKSHSQDFNCAPTFVLGRVVSMAFFWEQHIEHDISRGPFLTSQQWLTARLLLTQMDANTVTANSCDEDELEVAETRLDLVSRLFRCMPRYLRSEEENNGLMCCLHHDDLSSQNILVDLKHGTLNGIVDWECVNYVPLWKACQIPRFLRSRDRPKALVYEDYLNDDGTLTEGYPDDQLEYELTMLRSAFLDRMAEIQPLWTEVYEASGEMADFCFGVENCDHDLYGKWIGWWLDNQDAGRPYYSLLQSFKK